MIQEVKEITKKYCKKGQVPCHILIPTEKGFACVIFEWKDAVEKDNMFARARQLISEMKPEYYYYVSEAYMSHDVKYQPSQDPNRKDILIVCEYRKDLKNKTYLIPIIRDNGQVTFGEEIVTTEKNEQQSRFNFYLEDVSEEFHEKILIENMIESIPQKIKDGLKETFTKAMGYPPTEEDMEKIYHAIVKLYKGKQNE